jgi:hypothetical protein
VFGGSVLKLLFLIILVSIQAQAFRDQFMNGNDDGAAAVYKFDEGSGTTAFDSGNLVSPLDLTLQTTGNLPTGDDTPIRINASFMPTSSNPGFSKLQLFNYESALGVADSGVLISRINNPISPMPNINGGLMPQKDRDLIKLWTMPEDGGDPVR